MKCSDSDPLCLRRILSYLSRMTVEINRDGVLFFKVENVVGHKHLFNKK